MLTESTSFSGDIPNTSNNIGELFKCMECDYVSESQGGLGVHRVKKHRNSILDNIESVCVTCEYPKGKSFYCCLCDNIIKTWPNFMRHFKNVHTDIPLTANAWCSMCNRLFDDLKGAGVHMKREHGISSTSIIPPSSPSPIMSVANYIDSQDSSHPCHTAPNTPKGYPKTSSINTRNRSKGKKLTRSNRFLLHSPRSSQLAITPDAPSPAAYAAQPLSSLDDISTDPITEDSDCYSPTLDTPSSIVPSMPTPTLLYTPILHKKEPMVDDLHSSTHHTLNASSPSLSQENILQNVSVVAFDGCTAADSSSYASPDSTQETPSQPFLNTPHNYPAPVLHDLPYTEDDDDDDGNDNATLTQNLPPPFTQPIPNQPTDFEGTQESLPTQSSSENQSPFVQKWLPIFDSNPNWQEFSEQCDLFVNDVLLESDKLFKNKKRAAPRRPDRPSAKPVNNNRRPLQYNPIEARRIQNLYRISKKRAARQVIGDNKPSYSGSVDEATKFFSDVFGVKTINHDDVKNGLSEDVPSGPIDDSLGFPISPSEVVKKLRSSSNTSPGADRVEYRHLKAVDPKGQILSSIFNRCLTENDVPIKWKASRTILIHKKGDASAVANFRPIALMSCIYKLFMSIMANRLVKYSIDNDLLSTAQKSARPTEGCYEHTFILQSLVLDAKRHQKNLFLSWLDLQNAFGSVVNLVKNIYTDATTEVRTPNGFTPNINILAGVKQGCPLSPILFNLCIEIIIRAISSTGNRIGPVKHYDHEISVLAYADDLVIIAKTKDKLQKLLDVAGQTADLVGLEFRPDKCASLSMVYGKRHCDNIQINVFKVQGNEMPALKEHEHYRYLGVPIGMIRDISSLDNLVDDLCSDLDRICNSLLAPWQKVDAIRTFVQPALTFALRAGEPLKSSLEKYKKKLVEVVRGICNLPMRGSSLIIFASTSVGGLGLQDPLAEVDVQTVVQAIRMLSSSDPFVAAVSKGELIRAVKFATQSDPSPNLVCDFLSGVTTGRLHPNRLRYRTHSLWTRTRIACRHLHITFNIPENGSPSISTQSKGPCGAKSASSFLHRLVQDSASEKLMDLPDQGKVARALNKDSFSNGSSWLYSGLNMRFSDWRIIHRARLNVVPKNQNKSRWSDCSEMCRICDSYPETLPHIICHCHAHMVQIRKRHDSIIDRLKKGIRAGNVRIDQQVPGIDSECRPDILIDEGHTVTIIDVTCPFENGEDALSTADYNKIMKYNHLKVHFNQLGVNCSVFGFVIGALGAWHPNNEAVLEKLQMSRSYKSLFRNLCCSDVIRGSAEIYYNHMKEQ